MSSNDADFSAAAELALRIPDAEKRRVESEVSDIGPVMLSAGSQRGSGAAGGGGQVQQSPAQLNELETATDLAEEQLRVDELRNDLLRELLEDSGAALAGGGGGGGGGGGAGGGLLGGGGLITRVAGGGGALGGIGAASLGAAGLAIPGAALGGILSDDSNTGQLTQTEDGVTVTTPNPEASQTLAQKISEGLNINRPSWLTADGTVGVEDPDNVRVDLVEETLNEDSTSDDGSEDRPGPGGSTPPSQYTGGPDSIVKNEQLIEDSLDAGGDLPGGGSNSGGSPGGSTAPVSEVGGPDRNTSTGAGLVEAVLGDVGSTPDGSPGGSTPSRTGGLNEAAARRRQEAPNIDVEASVESDGISERRAEKIAEDKATEAAEKIRDEIQRSRR
jgi:hypothetical protein